MTDTLVPLSQTPLAPYILPSEGLTQEDIGTLYKARVIEVITIIAATAIIAAAALYHYMHLTETTPLLSGKTMAAGMISHTLLSHTSSISEKISSYILCRLGDINNLRDLLLLKQKQKLLNKLEEMNVDCSDAIAYAEYLKNEILTPLLNHTHKTRDLAGYQDLKTFAVQLAIYIAKLNAGNRPELLLSNKSTSELLRDHKGSSIVIQVDGKQITAQDIYKLELPQIVEGAEMEEDEEVAADPIVKVDVNAFVSLFAFGEV